VGGPWAKGNPGATRAAREAFGMAFPGALNQCIRRHDAVTPGCRRACVEVDRGG